MVSGVGSDVTKAVVGAAVDEARVAVGLGRAGSEQAKVRMSVRVAIPYRSLVMRFKLHFAIYL
jgi:hypothetical protein